MRSYFSVKQVVIHLSIVCWGITAIVPVSMAANTATIAPTQVKLSEINIDQLQQAAEAGDPDAQYALGYMYYYGQNIKQDSVKALNWIKRAAVQGQSEAMKALALLDPDFSARKTENPATKENVNTSKTTAASTTAVSETDVSVAVKPVVKKSTAQPVTHSAQKNAPVAGQYTVQLRASSSKQDLVNYAKKYQLQEKVSYSQSTRNGKLWYTLQYGAYKTRAEAQAAMAKLPEAIKSSGAWVKPVSAKK